MVAAQAATLAAPQVGANTGEQPAFFEKVLVVGAFLIFLGTFRTLLSGGGADRTDGSPLFRAAVGSLYLVSMVIVAARGVPSLLLRLLARGWPLVVLTLLALASTIWSQDPGPTLRRAVALTLGTWFVFYVAT